MALGVRPPRLASDVSAEALTRLQPVVSSDTQIFSAQLVDFNEVLSTSCVCLCK